MWEIPSAIAVVFAELDPTFIKLEIAQLQSDLKRLRSDLTYYDKEAKRYIKLVKKNTAAQSELDLHIRNFESAEALLRSTQLKLNVDREHLRRYTLRGPAGMAGYQALYRAGRMGQ